MNSKAQLPPRQAQRKRTSQPKKRKKMAVWLKVVLSILLILVLLVIGFGAYVFFYGNNKLDDISTAPKDGNQSATVPATLKPKEEPFSFVLMGIDYRPELPGRRTDVLMVGAIHPDTKEAALVSLPRDMYFQIPGYGPDKLTHFYPNFYSLQSRGQLDSETPEDEMKVMLGQFFDMDIDYAAVINFQGFVDVIDALGGVEVNVDQNMCYKDSVDGTDINLKEGYQTLDGDNALDFVRYRKSNCSPMTAGTTETDRNVRQNAVIKEMIKNMQSLGGITKITKVIDAVADNFTIDMTPSQIRNSLTTYLNINTDDIYYLSVDGQWQSPYVYADEAKLEEAKQMLHKVMNGETLKTPEPVTDSVEAGETGESMDTGSGN